MTTVKIAACCLIVLSCALLGLHLADRLRRQAATIEQLKRLLRTLSDGIAFSLEPLPTLLDRAAGEELGVVSEFAACVAQELKSNRNGTLRDTWLSALDRFRRRLGVSDATVRVLQNLGRSLGTMSRDIEVGNLHIALDALDEEERRVRALYDQNGKMYRSLSVIAGILLALLFF